MAPRSLAGQLLVATPGLVDPNFARTVVLVLHHDEEGGLGLVLNRPTGMPVSEPLPQWMDLAAEPPVVFVGGPVSPGSAICLALREPGPPEEGGHREGPGPVGEPPFLKEQGDPAGPWRPVLGDRLGTLDLNADRDQAGPGLNALRVFAGYAGWGPGQLDSEVERGGWLVVGAEAGDAMTGQPGDLWKRVLRRQGGELAILAAYPLDLSAN